MAKKIRLERSKNGRRERTVTLHMEGGQGLLGEAGMFRDCWTHDDASFDGERLGEGDVEGGPAQVAATTSVLQEPRPEGLISHANTTMYRGKVVQTRDAGGLVLDPADQGEWSRFWEAFCPSGNIAPENLRANSVRRCFSIIEPVALSVFLCIGPWHSKGGAGARQVAVAMDCSWQRAGYRLGSPPAWLRRDCNSATLKHWRPRRICSEEKSRWSRSRENHVSVRWNGDSPGFPWRYRH